MIRKTSAIHNGTWDCKILHRQDLGFSYLSPFHKDAEAQTFLETGQPVHLSAGGEGHLQTGIWDF